MKNSLLFVFGLFAIVVAFCILDDASRKALVMQDDQEQTQTALEKHAPHQYQPPVELVDEQTPAPETNVVAAIAEATNDVPNESGLITFQVRSTFSREMPTAEIWSNQQQMAEVTLRLHKSSQ